MIRELEARRDRVSASIATLEKLQAEYSNQPAKSRRGRKSMSPEERREVSARMKRYWAGRRKAKHKGASE